MTRRRASPPAPPPADPFARTRLLAKSQALKDFLRGMPITEAVARAFWGAPPDATGAALQVHLTATERALRETLAVAGQDRTVPDVSTVYGLLNLHRLLVGKYAPGAHVEPVTTPLFKPNGDGDDGDAGRAVEVADPGWGSWVSGTASFWQRDGV